MNAEEQKTVYLSKVAAQIYSTRTRKEVTAELSTHIDEEFETLNIQISDSKEAMRRTLEDIGEPCRLGSQFNRLLFMVRHWYLRSFTFIRDRKWNCTFLPLLADKFASFLVWAAFLLFICLTAFTKKFTILFTIL